MPVPDALPIATRGTIGRAVVTGSAGFIGSHLAGALLRDGAEVIGVDRRGCDSPGAEVNLGPLVSRPRYTHVVADLATSPVEPLLGGAEIVFHLAGIPGVRPSWGVKFRDYLTANILATQRVMNAATALGVRRVVVASSSSVYGPTTGAPSKESDLPRPVSPYAVTKLAEEQLCLAHAARPGCPTSVVALRYFTVYGPRQRSDMFIHRVLKAALTGDPLCVFGEGYQERDFTYINDAIAATIAAATAPVAGVINVGSGSGTSLREVIAIADELTGCKVRFQTRHAHDGDVPATRADTHHARTVLGWAPEAGLKDGMCDQLQALIQTDGPLQDRTVDLSAVRPRDGGDAEQQLR